MDTSTFKVIVFNLDEPILYIRLSESIRLLNERKILMKSNSNNNVKISIIIPVYNSEKYLHKCINSVCSQTHKNLEIIIINDGSTDKSDQIIDYYKSKDDRIFSIKTKNLGQSSARNKGIDLAKGEYIGFVDSDDFIEKSMYEVMLENAILESADIVQTGHYVIDGNDEILNIQKNNRVVYSTFYDSLKARLFYEVIKSSVCDKLFHRSLWTENRMKEGYYYEDGMVLLELLKIANKVLILNEVGYYYFMSKTSTQRGPYNIKHLESCIYEPQFYYEFLEHNCSEFINFALAKNCYRAIRGYRFTQEIKYLNERERREYKGDFYVRFLKNYQKLKKTSYYDGLDYKNKIAFYIFKINPKIYLFIYNLK